MGHGENTMNDFLWQAFVTLLVIIDPVAVVPMFVALTRNESVPYKRRTALKSTVIATVVLVSFAFVGDKLLDLMGISESAFRIAGGFLLLLAAIEMVVARNSGLRSTTGDEAEESVHRDDISVFPIAIPLIAGPGALTSVVVLMRQAETIDTSMQVGVVLILFVILMITYVSLLLGDQLMRLLGVTGTNVLTRVFGIILAALAIQNIITGIKMVVMSMMTP